MGTDLPSSDTTLRDQALALFVRRLERRFSPVTWWQWWYWSRSPEHRRAYSEVQSLWGDLGRVFAADRPVVIQHSMAPPRAPAALRAPRWQLAAIVLAFGVFTSTTVPITSPTPISILTEVGQWAEQQLDDGTTVHIGPRTRIEVSYDESHRNVQLIGGEVWFDVAKDRARPFIVNTALGTIRATGTVFGVGGHLAETVVTVAEGTVVVSGRTGDVDGVVLKSGQQMLVTKRGSTPPRSVNTERERAWALGKVVNVTGLTVAEVTHDLNERNRLQIRIDDPTLATMTLPFLSIRGDDPDTFVSYMSRFRSITAVREGSDTVRLEYTKPKVQ